MIEAYVCKRRNSGCSFGLNVTELGKTDTLGGHSSNLGSRTGTWKQYLDGLPVNPDTVILQKKIKVAKKEKKEESKSVPHLIYRVGFNN